MNKPGHIYVTGCCINETYRPYKRWLLFGSILPDLLFHTYLVGHTWETSLAKTVRGLQRLAKWGEMNGLSCLILGYYLHYVEDYFTHPHNKNFRGGFRAHIEYEKRFTRYLRQSDKSCKAQEQMMNAEQLIAELTGLHEEYLAQKQWGFATDERYIYQAAECVLGCFELILTRNRRMLDAARTEAFRIAASETYAGRGEA